LVSCPSRQQGRDVGLGGRGILLKYIREGGQAMAAETGSRAVLLAIAVVAHGLFGNVPRGKDD
jgi:hypothetical protein